MWFYVYENITAFDSQIEIDKFSENSASFEGQGATASLFFQIVICISFKKKIKFLFGDRRLLPDRYSAVLFQLQKIHM